MEVSKEILSELAENIEMGYKCFIHKETLEIVIYIDPEEYLEIDADDWKEEINKVKKDKKKFIEIDKMSSSESYIVMEEFIHSLDNNSTKIRLLQAIEGRKPFANFKHQIENTDTERQLWFAFRKEKNMEWIQDQLNHISA